MLCRYVARHCYSEQLAVSLRECRGYLRERVVGYHQQLVANSLLHDNDANNWTGKQPFYDVRTVPQTSASL